MNAITNTTSDVNGMHTVIQIFFDITIACTCMHFRVLLNACLTGAHIYRMYVFHNQFNASMQARLHALTLC
jgi:hypothetical protein